MSRYRKAQRNEVELPEIDGLKPILRVTRDEQFEAIEIFKDINKNQDTDLQFLRKYLSKILYNSLFLWENNQRTNKKEIGSEEITNDDIDDFVTGNIFEIWQEVLLALNIIDKDKFNELKEKLESKKEEENKKSPN